MGIRSRGRRHVARAAMIGFFAGILAGTSMGLNRDSGRTVLEGWREMASLPTVLGSHQVTECRDALVVTGGRGPSGKLTDVVLRGALSGDGELKSWTKEDRLPVRVAEHSAGVHGEALVVCGGIAASGDREQETNAVWSAPIGKRGVPGAWRPAGRLPYAVYAHGQASYGRWVYVVGGMSSGVHLNSVLRAEVVDGLPKAWEEVTPLPTAIAKAAILAVGRYLVVAGGQAPGSGKTVAAPTVYVAPIWEDGSISTWYLASAKLPGAWLGFGRMDATLAYHGGALFCFGGYDALWFPLANMAWAPFDEEKGEMGNWGVMNGPSGFPQLTRAASWKDRLYLVGGQVEGKACAKVLSARFVPGKAGG